MSFPNDWYAGKKKDIPKYSVVLLQGGEEARI